MDRIRIAGGHKLEGTIPISGAKNAALPLMIASLLTADRLTLKNVPNLADVALLARILRNHGVDHSIEGKRAATPHMGETFHLTARDIVDTTAPYEMVSRMRASFWVLGLGYLYGLTGTLNMADMADRVLHLSDGKIIKSHHNTTRLAASQLEW